MLHAYAQGIFPMAETATDPELFWVDPKRRGVFPLDGFHLSRSMRRFVQHHAITATLNADFEAVLFHCADREETWINPTLHANYTELYALGHCHSFEVWRDGALFGGVFGLTIGGAFFWGKYVFVGHEWVQISSRIFDAPPKKLWFCLIRYAVRHGSFAKSGCGRNQQSRLSQPIGRSHHRTRLHHVTACARCSEYFTAQHPNVIARMLKRVDSR